MRHGHDGERWQNGETTSWENVLKEEDAAEDPEHKPVCSLFPKYVLVFCGTSSSHDSRFLSRTSDENAHENAHANETRVVSRTVDLPGWLVGWLVGTWL